MRRGGAPAALYGLTGKQPFEEAPELPMFSGAAFPIRRSEADHVGAALHPQYQRIGIGIGNVEHHALAAVVDVIDPGGGSVRIRRAGTPVLFEHVERVVPAGAVGWAPHAIRALKIVVLERSEEALERLLLAPGPEIEIGRRGDNGHRQDAQNDALDPAPAAFFASSVGVQETGHTRAILQGRPYRTQPRPGP